MKRRRVANGFIVTLIILTSLIMSSAVPEAQNQPLNPKVIGAPLIETPGRSGGELSDASTTVPQSLTPLINPDEFAHLLQAGLLELNPLTMVIEPALAESYTVAEDNRQITFTLRPGVRWSDGEPLTVADIIFTFVDIFQNKELLTALKTLGLDISALPSYQLVKLDDHTVRFDLSASIADQVLAELTQNIAVVLPRHKLADMVHTLNPNAGLDALIKAWQLLHTPPDQIVGTGPFRLKEIQKTGIPFINERVTAIVLERNPFYWKVDTAGTPLPYVDRFTRFFVNQSSDALAKIKNGEIDLLKVGSDVAPTLVGQPGLQLIIDGPGLSAEFLAFNQDALDPDLKALFRDVRFRQAVAHTIDRSALLKAIPEREPFLIARESFVHPLLPFFNQSATTKFAFDFDKANALLDQIGLQDSNGEGVREFPSGKPVSFQLITNDSNPLRVAIGPLIAEKLKQVGIRADFKAISFDEVVRQLDMQGKKPTYQAVVIGFTTGGSLFTADDLGCFFSSQGACHIQRFSDAQGQDLTETQHRLDEIFNMLSQGIMLEKRTELWIELQQILSQDISLIPLLSSRAITAIRSSVQNAQNINLFGPASFLEVLWKK